MNTYYRPYKKNNNKKLHSNIKGKNFVLVPFLFLLIIISIIVLSFQLFGIYNTETHNLAATLEVIQGDVSLNPWGEDDDVKAFNKQKVFEGDAVATMAGAKAVLNFPDGSLLRLDSNTRVLIESVAEHSEEGALEVKLDVGGVWYNGVNASNSFMLHTLDSKVVALNSVFAIEKANNTVVRVFKKDVDINVLKSSNIRNKVSEKIVLGVGQMTTLSPNVFKLLRSGESVDDLKIAINDDFKTTNWFKLNYAEDGGVNLALSPGVSEAEAVVINEEEKTKDKPEEAEKSKFVIEETPIASEQAPSTEKSVVKETSENLIEDDEPKEDLGETIVLQSPSVLTFNGTNNSTVTAGPVLIVGNVDKRSVAITVNDFKLTLFKPGDGRWSYYAKEEFGNLNPGENKYKVFSEDLYGNQSPVYEFTIIYNKPEPEVVVEEDSTNKAEIDNSNAEQVVDPTLSQ